MSSTKILVATRCSCRVTKNNGLVNGYQRIRCNYYHSWVGFESYRDELIRISRDLVVADSKAHKECQEKGWSTIGSILSEINYYYHAHPELDGELIKCRGKGARTPCEEARKAAICHVKITQIKKILVAAGLCLMFVNELTSSILEGRA